MPPVESGYRIPAFNDVSVPMTTTHERASLLTVLLLAVSTASYAQTAEINPDWPDWIQKDMQRESGELRMDTFEAAEGAYRFQLPRRSKPLKGTEGFWGYTVEIGSDIPIACYLYSEDLPMTEIAVNIGEGAINEMLDRYEADEEGFRTLHYLDAGSIDGTVFLALEWLSRLDTDDGGVLVHTKIRAATDGGIVQVCWHSEPGYRETFENVFTTFVRSMQYSREVIEPFAADITVDTTNGTVTGAN